MDKTLALMKILFNVMIQCIIADTRPIKLIIVMLQLMGKKSPLEIKRQVHRGNYDRRFDKRANNGRKRCARIDTKYSHSVVNDNVIVLEQSAPIHRPIQKLTIAALIG
ncbi:MAG: hypothetical protein GY803_05640 [Chloroflexi bacterium]|nr:hypothetical protein [Chloroflexota bacterium]